MIFKGGPSREIAYVPSIEGSGLNVVRMILSLERMIIYDNNVRRHTFASLQVLGTIFSCRPSHKGLVQMTTM
jgi:hypothetical protein